MTSRFAYFAIPSPSDTSGRQVMEQTGHRSSWSTNLEHHPNGSISNGYYHTIDPPHHNIQGFHPLLLPSGQQYGQRVGFCGPSSCMGQHAGSAPQVRRKQVRATQACNHCRSRKQKCDEARPCQFCRENGFDCQYKDVLPPRYVNTYSCPISG